MNLKLEQKYESYPTFVKDKIQELRILILNIAFSDDEIDFIGERLKWGEPSFLTKRSGSTLRIDWKEKRPDHISLFFNCSTKLVSIFKEIYPNDFKYIGNREIRLPLSKNIDVEKIADCIEMTLKYNLMKNQF